MPGSVAGAGSPQLTLGLPSYAADDPGGWQSMLDVARMAENLERSYGLIYSQRVLLKLTEAGLARQKAYEIVQKTSMRAWRERRAFYELLAADPAVTEHLSPADLKACFDPSWYLRNVNAVFRRAGLA